MGYVWAFDLGTNCGYAVGGAGNDISGVWDMRPSRYDSGGMRFVRFRDNLTKMLGALGKPDIVVYEEVRRHAGTDAAHIYGGLMAGLQQWCIDNKVDYEAVPVGAIKKFATGKGNATKEAMIEAAKKLGYAVIDDNHADALHLLRLKLNEMPA